jgi:hypothetical protein
VKNGSLIINELENDYRTSKRDVAGSSPAGRALSPQGIAGFFVLTEKKPLPQYCLYSNQ